MTKTLTEQWYNGTLEESMYYVKLPENDVQIANIYQLKQLALVKDSDKIEVLAAVPTYEQYIGLIDDSKELDKAYDKINLLQKRLAIATKALKRYEDKQNWDIRGVAFMKYNKGFTIARKALKEMEGVK